MKLRIRGNSIRLRVTRGELASIASDGLVEEIVDFGSNALRYRLVRDPEATAAQARFADQIIEVRLPAVAVDAWAHDEAEVSIDAEQRLDAGALRILVEKDFACLQPRAEEDESDMFAHPNTDDLKC
ncbi:MAG: hypothetical protein AAGA68_09530 [Pseudomonadota bacterium]